MSAFSICLSWWIGIRAEAFERHPSAVPLQGSGVRLQWQTCCHPISHTQTNTTHKSNMSFYNCEAKELLAPYSNIIHTNIYKYKAYPNLTLNPSIKPFEGQSQCLHSHNVNFKLDLTKIQTHACTHTHRCAPSQCSPLLTFPFQFDHSLSFNFWHTSWQQRRVAGWVFRRRRLWQALSCNFKSFKPCQLCQERNTMNEHRRYTK